MTKRILILGQVPYTTLIESLVKAVEGKFGDKVECVQIHEKDAEFLTHIVPSTDKTVRILPDVDESINKNGVMEEDEDVILPVYRPKSIIIKPIEPVENQYAYEPKKKGHERPYKYHP